MALAPQFDDAFRIRLRELLMWRRDVRRFRRDPLPEGTIERLIDIACLAPSVGLSQPWRFVLVETPERRDAIACNFAECNAAALAAQAPERAAHYARLKLAGLDDAPCHLAVFADPATQQGHGIGRLTMPEMIEYSVVASIHTLWLAARAEGIGMGWVSMFEPEALRELLRLPPGSRPIAILCLGHVASFYARPMLEEQDWAHRCDLHTVVAECWGDAPAADLQPPGQS